MNIISPCLYLYRIFILSYFFKSYSFKFLDTWISWNYLFMLVHLNNFIYFHFLNHIICFTNTFCFIWRFIIQYILHSVIINTLTHKQHVLHIRFCGWRLYILIVIRGVIPNVIGKISQSLTRVYVLQKYCFLNNCKFYVTFYDNAV